MKKLDKKEMEEGERGKERKKTEKIFVIPRLFRAGGRAGYCIGNVAAWSPAVRVDPALQTVPHTS